MAKWGHMFEASSDLPAIVECMMKNARECGAGDFVVFRHGQYVGWVSPPDALKELPDAKVIGHG